MMRSILVFCLLSLCGLQVAAQPLTIACASKTSSTYSMALAVAAAAADTGMDLRPQPFRSTSQGLGYVESGEIMFGLDNAVSVRLAALGEGKFANHQMPGLRLLARLQPMRMALAVRGDSGIDTIADLQGKRLPSGFMSAVTGETLVTALLASGGLDYDNVERVQVRDFTAMAEAFVADKIDAMIHVIGSPRDDQVSREVGGLLPLEVIRSDETEKMLAQVFPEGSIVIVDPAPGLTTITRPVMALQYDYFIYTSATAPDDIVVAMIEALQAGKDDMAAAVASLKWFDPDGMYVDIGVPYHPAAEAFYRAHGLLR